MDWWDRKEFQSRGAIHNHMIVSCKDGTVPEDVVYAEVPRGVEDNPMVHSVKSYVCRLQIHICCENKCFIDSRGKQLTKCKYGCPFPVQEGETLNKADN